MRHLYLVPQRCPREEEITTKEAAERFGFSEELFLSVAERFGWRRGLSGLWDFSAIEDSLGL